ncbi:MAG: hypothetical protein LBD57_02595 [Endomicrobium sp.]|jgi:putative FmdB family regulatory protein|uniref:FmdB family zinc ribbon protein n=1 Tax=Candidatus Endomicrobiellum cubanum TaxID=3242325 RepID=UPI00282ECEC9|nr:hypothetical protein [Endomicrobium sp.]
MPVFEFACNNCKEHFEMLILESESKIECPKCKSVDTIKQFSTFSAKSQSNKYKCCSGCCHH